jgi:hypothetical protein
LRTYIDIGWASLVLSIGNSAILLNDNGETTVALRTGKPGMVLCEERLGVAKEELLLVSLGSALTLLYHR